MTDQIDINKQLEQENEMLRARLEGAEAALEAIRSGAVDALVISSDQGEQVYTLQGAEHPYRVLVETMNEGAVTMLADGSIIYSNPRLAALLGKPLETLIGSSILDFIAPPDLKAFQAAIKQGFTHSMRAEIHLLSSDQNSIPVLISFSPIQIDGSQGLCLVVTDLTEHYYANQLKQSNELLQDLAFVASHDMQEPLRKIISFGNLIKNKNNLAEPQKSYLQRMQDTAHRMQKMIDDLLELSLITTQQNPYEPVDLNAVAKTVVDDLDARIRESQGQVILNPLPIIEADLSQMHRLIQNLVGNALKFHHPEVPPVVQVGYRNQSPENVELYVQDNGIGFDMSLKDQIFQPFRRLHGHSEYEGSGIGLAICQRIVNRHRGRIKAHSVPGQGSTFLVRLPVKQARDE